MEEYAEELKAEDKEAIEKAVSDLEESIKGDDVEKIREAQGKIIEATAPIMVLKAKKQNPTEAEIVDEEVKTGTES